MAFKTIIRWLEILSAIWWASAFVTTGLTLTLLPVVHSYPGPAGCYYASDLIFHISCKGTWNDEIIAGILSFAFHWTAQSPIILAMAIMSKSIIGFGFVVVWLASLSLAVRLLFRLIAKASRIIRS